MPRENADQIGCGEHALVEVHGHLAVLGWPLLSTLHDMQGISRSPPVRVATTEGNRLPGYVHRDVSHKHHGAVKRYLLIEVR
ncbi:hypothetical protein D3C81_2129750 [compost metagenome]